VDPEGIYDLLWSAL